METRNQPSGAPELESHFAPIRVSAVALRVRDLGRVSRFYRDVVGLETIRDDGRTLSLGVEGAALVRLNEDAASLPQPAGAPGLFHTAFVLPTRADLGRWLRHAAAVGLRIEGAADHLVSEAVYLSDPEGNGIEIYRDRPRVEWPREGGRLRMANARLDVEGLLALGPGTEPQDAFAMPVGARVGHVHLNVTDLGSAAETIERGWGFDEMCRYPGALFFATGGYHHHIATNVWSARGPITRDPRWAGLDHVQLEAADRIAYDDLARRWHAAGGAVEEDRASVTALGGLRFDLAVAA
jgi:catechol 2,3-dioxygenase